jgi:hypothetical protein
MPTLSHLGYRQLFKFWFPLQVTWLMMAAEGSFLSAVIARLPEPEYNLAAFGVAFAVTLFIEAPVLSLVSASNSLIRDWSAYLQLRRFATGILLGVSLIMGLGLLPPVFLYLTEGLIGLPRPVALLTWKAAVVLLPVPWAIGYRRFYHGLLIQYGRTRLVAVGTSFRLVTMALTGIALFAFSDLPGAAVGAWALAVGVILEAAVSRLMAVPVLRALREKNETPRKEGSLLTHRAIASFYFPLALTSMLALGINPVISYFLAHGRMAIESLAVWPVIQALLLIFMSFGLSFHETAIALLGVRMENFTPLRNFSLCLGLFAVGLFTLFGFSPLSGVWFQQVSGLSPELTGFISRPVRWLAPLPLLWMALTFQRSVLVNARRTAAITWATFLEIVLIVLVMFIGIHVLDAIGVLAASAALLLGRLGCVAYLLRPLVIILRQTRNSSDPPNPDSRQPSIPA